VAKDETEDKEKEISACRFTRMAPVSPLPEKRARLIHYCSKDNVRQFFDVCKAKGCGHLRPLRPPDEGSCTFRPKKQKEAEKKANGKKNDKKLESQDREEEVFVEDSD